MLLAIAPIWKKIIIEPAKYIGARISFINQSEDQFRIIPNAAKFNIITDPYKKILGLGSVNFGDSLTISYLPGNPKKYTLPKPIINRGGCNLSFAGLKTAVLRISKQIKTEQEKYDLAASFQSTIEEILYKKSKVAFEKFKNINGDKDNTFVVAGGVAANKKIRKILTNLCEEENFKSIFPPINLCGDNAAMIAMVGLEKFKMKQFDDLDHPAKPRWALDENAKFLKGANLKY